MNPKTFFMAYKLVRRSRTAYGMSMKFIDRTKSRIRFIAAIVIAYALIVLGLLIYIAVRVG